nr:nucleic acid-binding, OB-fold protein [Tanacetum cinerariifolium]
MLLTSPTSVHCFETESTYRISNFVCIQTSNYQQTLDTETTLKFEKCTKFDSISSDGFPKHYFNFASYNQLSNKTYNPDRPTSEKQPTPHSGNVVELALWDDMGCNFNVADYNSMERPVIIAVSSFKVKIYGVNAIRRCSTVMIYLNVLTMDHNQTTHLAISDETGIDYITFFTPNADIPTEIDCPKLKGKVDFYFDTILDKPLQIASSSEQAENITDKEPSVIAKEMPKPVSA